MSDYARLLTTLSKLVGYKTDAVNQDQIENCVQYIEKTLATYKLHSNRYKSNGNTSLVISTSATRHPKLLLAAHCDVVPGYPEQFELMQKDGKLWGRGVFDMKFAVACYLEMLHDLKPKLDEYDLAIMLTFDEEQGGHNGVEYLLSQGYSADLCVLPDGSDDWKIEASAKGYAITNVSTKGTSAHGSRPWEGDNAAIHLMDLMQKIEKSFPYRQHLGTTVTPTRLQAGSAANQVPGEASVDYDIRFPENEELTKTLEKLGKLCGKVDAEVTVSVQAAAVEHDTKNPGFETWQSIVKEVVGVEPSFSRSFGASDARYLVPAGIPTIITRPPGGGAHSGEEWISEKGFYDYYEVLRRFVEATARTPVDL